jgi:uncharacterized membrane protein YqiK
MFNEIVSVERLLFRFQPPVGAVAWDGWFSTPPGLAASLGIACAGAIVFAWLTTRYIPNNYVGIVEKLWSPLGSVTDGQIIALEGEAGFQAEILRGGLHFGLWRWQFKVHKVRLVTIGQGKIGYVYARDGEPLPPSQTLARVVPSNNFQDARAFLNHIDVENGDLLRGQRGRQRAILREGVYAINLAVFVVITDDAICTLRSLQSKQEFATIVAFHHELQEAGGFDPLVIGRRMETRDPLDPSQKLSVDSIGIVTVHDGPSLPPGEIIASMVGVDAATAEFHNNFQDPEALLAAGGRRGRQLQVLTDGTYFINRWFATVELIPKTVVPIGYVGVVVSYHGRAGADLSSKQFRHGEQVAEGERGVWERALGPGKYPFNTYAGNILLVPTTNFVLHWITGKSETHRYDESLRSIDLVTKDAYEPLLPLSVVVHIDYQRAPSVVQRFGDVKKLITQTLDPMLSAYFRDIAHKKTMLALLHERDEIQQEARDELCRKFREFDIECVDVLIGKPQTTEGDDKIETLLEQLRQRQLSQEQLETYERRKVAAEKLRELNAAQAQADMQTALSNAQVQARIAESQGEADLARARKQAEQTVVVAEATLARARREAEQKVVLAEAESRERILAGRGESQRIMQVGLSEASVLLRKIASFGDPRLFAVSRVAEHLAHSRQPLVPERMFIAGANGENGKATGANGLVGLLVSLMVAEKSGFQLADTEQTRTLREFADRMTAKVMHTLEEESGPLPAIATRSVGSAAGSN